MNDKNYYPRSKEEIIFDILLRESDTMDVEKDAKDLEEEGGVRGFLVIRSLGNWNLFGIWNLVIGI
jgi:hypothetical protein